jgi:AraC family transcriptional regulator of adaptative response/methylated-DNA-[protein]-cysteine methyltransferase
MWYPIFAGQKIEPTAIWGIARFKQHLRAGQSISSACYEVGYRSSRALYEKTRKGLGMTPAVYRRGGKGIRACYAITDSLLGRVLVAGTK